MQYVLTIPRFHGTIPRFVYYIYVGAVQSNWQNVPGRWNSMFHDWLRFQDSITIDEWCSHIIIKKYEVPGSSFSSNLARGYKTTVVRIYVHTRSTRWRLEDSVVTISKVPMSRFLRFRHSPLLFGSAFQYWELRLHDDIIHRMIWINYSEESNTRNSSIRYRSTKYSEYYYS